MSMLFDVSRLRSGVDRVSRRFEASEFASADDDLRISAPVELDLEVHKDGRKVRLIGQVRTALAADCSRCLDSFVVPVAADLDALFLPASGTVAGAGQKGQKEEALDVEDLGVSFYENETIDLGALMREQFYLSLPMKPLCQPDCRGLCPVCGVNRNRESCHCKAEWTDPRLDVLRRFSQ